MTACYDAPEPCNWDEKTPMQKVNVLNLERISAMDRAKIAAIDPTVNLTNA